MPHIYLPARCTTLPAVVVPLACLYLPAARLALLLPRPSHNLYVPVPHSPSPVRLILVLGICPRLGLIDLVIAGCCTHAAFVPLTYHTTLQQVESATPKHRRSSLAPAFTCYLAITVPLNDGEQH